CPTASPPDEWELYCRDPYQDYQACDQPPDDPVDPMDPADPSDDGYFGGGCNANGGASSLLLVAAVFGLRRRRGRRAISRR
ncbi:MAG TPA: hypothetical protein VFV99_22485, partial [Kofleriaceae bacterium]|nr:hypothetical protein [Kofleriaceae bacterium]